MSTSSSNAELFAWPVEPEKKENSFNKNDIHKQKSCTWLIAAATARPSSPLDLMEPVNTHFPQEKTAWMVQQQHRNTTFLFFIFPKSHSSLQFRLTWKPLCVFNS